ncbi:D-tyrosyl-tRNA(Tyr) deacylase [Streptomyces sp. WAC 00631]|uniref:D-aminoacyl-tRNA deacylase n=1 Tax=unclassified Streptomyces TaxID=2593676 RepID=UPI000F79D75A|nr:MULTISPECIES: D-aminoacyl-tRNA deacylase [unclassified Streptomyces]MCC5032701.1 D-tyrosyl-tRNA(Tyr) deacylase [Streptomyces sp. WAC 00631]MCC9740779.1 D-tyrosyl-tRNA(Tyr) deacylase [Streptomyces sp. MNU89]
MRAVVQRVSGASVVVDGETVGEIRGRGLCVLVGVTHDDTKEKAERLARKLWTVRLFDGDGDGGEEGGGEGGAAGPGSEKSCSDLGAPLMVISQFTLYGDARKGRRPTWNAAAPGELAEPLVDEVVAQLRSLGARVETGRFGADMKVSLTNDGPFTVLLEV